MDNILMGFLKPPQPQTMGVPEAPANPPMFGQDSEGKKPQRKSPNPTFLGASANPSPALAQGKTLLGA